MRARQRRWCSPSNLAPSPQAVGMEVVVGDAGDEHVADVEQLESAFGEDVDVGAIGQRRQLDRGAGRR